MKYLSLISVLAATPLSFGQIPDGFEPATEDVDIEIENAKNLRRRRLMENIHNNPNPFEGPWPECVGMKGEECKVYIEGWLAELAPPGIKEHFVRIVQQTSSYQPDRVWIQSDEFGKVLGKPQIG